MLLSSPLYLESTMKRNFLGHRLLEAYHLQALNDNCESIAHKVKSFALYLKRVLLPE